jgi:phospholipid/cholesterol/gamma-HCH transport system ATP-binding protein
MITVEQLNKSFGDNHVLRGIDSVFEEGKTSLIIGRSGSGKTVFLKCVLGLYEADSGEIAFGGRPISGLNKIQRRELRKEIGMVFQGGALFDNLTVAENVMFPLNMFSNMTQIEKDDRVSFVLKRVQLEDAVDRFPAEISGGMQKRVAIARAISMNPKYLFCDEPNSGLDPDTSIVIDNLIRELTQEYKMTTVINTHDMNSVLEIGDHVVFLKEGVKAWEGSRDQILTADQQDISDYVFRSNLFKKVKAALRAQANI